MVGHLFIFGLGYSAGYIAQAAMAQGFTVSGTCRDNDRCAALKDKGINAYRFEEVTPELLAPATHILTSIPPQEGQGDIVLPPYGKYFVADWLGYLSTTGVYGDWQGEWVNEESEARAGNPRLERRVIAEKQWLERGAHVFRLAGIYGPGRNVLEDVKDGTARRIEKPGQVFSRIHVEDIARTVLASMLAPAPGNIYNVCDDEPAPAGEVVEYACVLLGAPVPPLLPLEEAQLSAMGREFYSANRRVSNRKIKEKLGVRLAFPTYREGLRAINH